MHCWPSAPIRIYGAKALLIAKEPHGELGGLPGMLRTLEHDRGRPTPVPIGALARLPLRQRRNPPFARGRGGICLDDPGTPGCREPGGNGTSLQVMVPAIGEVWLGLDELLVDYILPVGGDL
jgi:hypothetical protein